MEGVEELLDDHKELLRKVADIQRCASQRGKGLEDAAGVFFEDYYSHSVREERGLYRALWDRSRELRPLLESLLDEHKRVVELSFQLKKAFEHVQDDPVRLEMVARNLANHTASHFAREERNLFPEAQRLLSP